MELLVVVTIIVLLLALLTPALSRAVYQGQLLGCGAGPLRMMTVGVQHYAMQNKRYYPDRGIQELDRRGTVTYLPAMALAYPSQGGFDARPPLRPLFPINSAVQCPFNTPVEMDETDDDINVEASYMLLWGWQYKLPDGADRHLPGAGRKLQGMFRLGDRFEWTEGDRTNTYNVLAADMDLLYASAGSVQGSHPDRDPQTMWQLVAVEAPGFWPRNNLSRWANQLGSTRGAVDLNFAYDDGSVLRLENVIGWNPNRRDPRVDRLPLQYDVVRPSDEFHLPTKQ